MQISVQHYIDGSWVNSIGGNAYRVIDPATEEPVSEIILGSEADIDAAVSAARRAFPAYAQTSPQERATLLRRIVDHYQARADDLARATSQEMGAPIAFAQAAQVPVGLGNFLTTIAALEAFEFREEVEGAIILHEPVGVVGLVTPWNWPLNQITAKLAPALAAGNTIVLKPSEEAPSTALILAEIMDAAGVPPGVFNLVNGNGPGAGAALARHPDVDMISFTGSTRGGIAVAEAAAASVKRVHQELGGKAPNLVLEGADLAAVLQPAVMGVLLNSGQSCIAPTRLLVHRQDADAAIAAARKIFEGTPVGDPAEPGMHIGPVVNRAQYDKIQSLIQSAIDEGATLVTGGPGRPEGRDKGYYVRPTLFADVTPDMRIFREEVFGPVATITSYGDIDEAVALANDTCYGLSAAISGDPKEAALVAPRLRAGLVTINGWAPPPGVPFGGYKQSGNGREGGKHGLADFMEIKAVVGGS